MQSEVVMAGLEQKKTLEALNLARANEQQDFDIKKANDTKESQRKAVYFSAIEQFFEEAKEQFYVNKGLLIAYLKELRSGAASRAEEYNAKGGRQEVDGEHQAMTVSDQLALLHKDMTNSLFGEANMFVDNMQKLQKTLASDIEEEHGQAITTDLEDDAEFQAVVQQHHESSRSVTTKLCQHFAHDAIQDVITIMPGVFAETEDDSYSYSKDPDENTYFKTLASNTRHAFKAFPRPEPGHPIENLEKEKHAPERWAHLLDELMPTIQARSMLRCQRSPDHVMSFVAKNPRLFSRLEPALSSAYRKPVNEACTMYSRSCAHVERCNIKIKEKGINQPLPDPFSIICQMQSGGNKPKPDQGLAFKNR
jgi:hypothetical protein